MSGTTRERDVIVRVCDSFSFTRSGVFVHASACGELWPLAVGQTIEFQRRQSPKGARAEAVTLADTTT